MLQSRVRKLVAVSLLLVRVTAGLLAVAGIGQAQTAKSPAPPRQNFDPPGVMRPDAATFAEIDRKIAALTDAVAALKENGLPDEILMEVEIYLKAAENIVRFDEWYTAASGSWALTTLDEGLARARQAETGTADWINTTGQWVVRAYRSEIDGSIQPYAVLLPHDFDRQRQWRLDVVLHGRDSSLSEAKFIATHRGPAPQNLGFVQLEVYGRGNNAYRWAGETDVFEALHWFQFGNPRREGRPPSPIDPRRIVLRGFSMGGAGTWHIGLHQPGRFCVIGPGAGFTTTRGYVADLPARLPDYVEDCLHIYDAVDYAENAFNVPVVAYSGEVDPQRMAAANMEAALREFREPLRFTHLVAPGLGHSMPKEWQDKAEVEYRKFADAGRPEIERVRFVTYTPRYGHCDWLQLTALRKTLSRALVDATREGNVFRVQTENVRRLRLWLDGCNDPLAVTLDGQQIDTGSVRADFAVFAEFEVVDGKWTLIADQRELRRRLRDKPEKRSGLQGPIDDAFLSRFVVIEPGNTGFHQATHTVAKSRFEQFDRIWNKYFRGELPIQDESMVNTQTVVSPTLVLFGDPASNSLIAHFLPKLPITWDQDRLIVNGVEYDARTHLPVLIYPNPIDPNHYIVINSGHTFSEADLKGTNALLYPHLGDWAVLRLTPTAADPGACEVVAAGLFDEHWQFQ